MKAVDIVPLGMLYYAPKGHDMQRIDIPRGTRFGRLTVVRTLSDPAPVYVLCKCDCGRSTKVYKSNLLRGKTRSCGCGERENLRRLHDALRNPMTPGDKYGMLTVLRNTRVGYSEFRCDCGKVVEKNESKVRSGETKSCGCLRVSANVVLHTTHGGCRTRLYKEWADIKKRCYNSKHVAYPRYGGKGVRMCAAWKDDFVAFRDWALSNGYREDLTIDRIDFRGNYCPENCRWIPSAKQAQNTSRNRRIEYRGHVECLGEWARIVGISRGTLQTRLNHGWTVEDAFTVRPERGGGKYKHKYHDKTVRLAKADS